MAILGFTLSNKGGIAPNNIGLPFARILPKACVFKFRAAQIWLARAELLTVIHMNACTHT